MNYKQAECCIWKCLLFFPSYFQWWMVCSSLGTMGQYSDNLRDGTISHTEEITPPAPSLTRPTSYVHSIRARKTMAAFSEVPDAGGDWPERKPSISLVLSSLWLSLFLFPLACRLGRGPYLLPNCHHSLHSLAYLACTSACQMIAVYPVRSGPEPRTQLTASGMASWTGPSILLFSRYL